MAPSVGVHATADKRPDGRGGTPCERRCAQRLPNHVKKNLQSIVLGAVTSATHYICMSINSMHH